MLQINYTDYFPQKVGLQYSPPTIVLDYLIRSSQKIYRHKIKLQRLNSKSNVQDFVEYIKKRHHPYIQQNKNVSKFPKKVLVTRLRDHLISSSQKKPLEAQGKEKQNLAQPKTTIAPKPYMDEQIKVQANVFEEIDVDDEYGDDFEEQSQQSQVVEAENINLNELTPEEGLKFKKKMDVKFNQNLVKPGDAGFVYDKRIEFNKQTKHCDWDDDEDD